jgi:hypothetical protein
VPLQYSIPSHVPAQQQSYASPLCPNTSEDGSAILPPQITSINHLSYTQSGKFDYYQDSYGPVADNQTRNKNQVPFTHGEKSWEQWMQEADSDLSKIHSARDEIVTGHHLQQPSNQNSQPNHNPLFTNKEIESTICPQDEVPEFDQGWYPTW